MSTLTELNDLRRRLEDLEHRQASERPPVAVAMPFAIDVQNDSGHDVNLGDWVEVDGVSSSAGVPKIKRPSGDGVTSVLGVVAQKIPNGDPGRVNVCGVVPARVDSTSNPSAGAELGAQKDSFEASPDHAGGGYFEAWIDQSEGLAWVLLQRTQLLRVDHLNHLESTEVFEEGVYTIGPNALAGTGHLHDLWKVIRRGGPFAGEDKLMHSIRVSGACKEGWVWGDVISEYAPNAQSPLGWGRWFDIIGIEGRGETKVNLKTWARFNDGAGLVGPIKFGIEPNTEEGLEGPWVYGKMVWVDPEWRPAIRIETVRQQECTPNTISYSTGDSDCNALQEPQEYQLSGMDAGDPRVIGPYRKGDSKDNYIEAICCLWDRMNLTFRLLQVLDRYYGNMLQSIDNWMITAFGTPGLPDYPTVVKCLDGLHANACNSGNLPSWSAICDLPANQPYEELGYKTTWCERNKGTSTQ